jgi:hypothetical protein
LDQAIDANFPGLREGALILLNTRNVPLAHYVTADLVKSPGAGVGRPGKLRADGELTKYTFDNGRILWSFRLDGVEFEL